MGECEARTQGALVAVATGATEDAASRRPARPATLASFDSTSANEPPDEQHCRDREQCEHRQHEPRASAGRALRFALPPVPRGSRVRFRGARSPRSRRRSTAGMPSSVSSSRTADITTVSPPSSAISNVTAVMLSSPPPRFAAASSGFVAASGRRGSPRARARIVVGVHHRREPVRAEQEDVARLRRRAMNDVDVDVRVGPERARDHGALRMRLGLLAARACRSSRARSTSEWSSVSCLMRPSRTR